MLGAWCLSCDQHGEAGYMGAVGKYSSGPDPGPEGPLSKLIDAIERAAQTGWKPPA